MFGPALTATSGISAVVNNWIEGGLRQRVALSYVSTLDDYVPGNYVRKARDALRAYRRATVLNRKGVDAVHIHLSSGMSFYRKLMVFRLAKIKGLKVIVHLHGSMFEMFYEQSSTVGRRLIASVFNGADAVIVLSDTWRQFLSRVSNNERTYVLYNTSSVGRFRPDKGADEKIVITCMGRLGSRKGTYDLIEAFARVSSRVPAAELVLGGDGALHEVQRFVEEKRIADRVRILGWVVGEEKRRVFERADVYVLPSYNEGLPGSIVEAMAAGAPIISTPVGGIPEAVVDGENGFLVQPGDVDRLSERLLQLCNDEPLRRTMGERSRHYVEAKFDTASAVERLIGIYGNVMQECVTTGNAGSQGNSV